jgi:uncharacterized protein
MRRLMRIEGTYTLPAAIEHVFAALLDPDLLQRIIPGCERLIQLGSATPESGVIFEVRVRSQKGPVVLTLQTIGVRRPDHVQVEMWGHAPDGPLSGQISVDLVEQGTHTLGAYVLVPTQEASAIGSLAISRDFGQEFVSMFCGRLADELYDQRAQREAVSEADWAQQAAAPSLAVVPLIERQFQTPYGRIVTLPHQWEERRWAQRALWMSAGVLVGVGVISVGIGLARWLDDHND